MQRVALYVRVSTEEQALHGLSIEAQSEALNEWAKENGCEVIGRYTDAGISARKKAAKRPDLQRLLEDVSAGKIDLIVFTKLDRWFRNIAEYYKVQEILEKYNVNWKTTYEDYDTSTAAGRLKINIMLSVAQDEADRTSERIKVVFDNKKQRKEPVSGRVPYGYRIEGKRVVVDEEAAPAVRALFEEYLASHLVSLAIIAAERANGKKMTYNRAKTMFRSPAYYGEINGTEDMCEPYITKEQFLEMKKIRGARARTATQNRIYLFSGILFCGDCGHRMAARTHRERQAYNCSHHYLGGECSNKVNISEKDIEKFLLENADTELKKYITDAKSKNVEKTNPDINISSIKRKLSRLKDLYVNEMIDIDAYKKDYNLYKSKIAEAEAAAPPETVDIDAIKRFFCNGWKSTYESLTTIQKRKFWITAISEIRVSPDRSICFSFR
ncbi:recombinase family protein [Oscillibacter sp.]|uniref:recombinase family protein n=1 Tax=Oscillibacter sp. TaxID=1945593 RepID=UPI0028A1A87E|nr:recombinase family protein [Oscillibacter sp.]